MANSLALLTSFNFTVAGSIMDVSVVFSTSTWQIYINGSLHSSNGSTISVNLRIGMFNYPVPDVGTSVPMVKRTQSL